MYALIRTPKCRALYGLVLGTCALLLFLIGFFPLKQYDGSVATIEDLPANIGSVSVDVKSLYKPNLNRLVFVVIDALRYDFVGSAEGKFNMPYTTSLVESEEACLLTAIANSPTVTMPRIKALTTGTVPNFIDVALNLGSHEIKEDNLLLQAKRNGMKIVFYGDDTWLKLFPDSFIRHEGTTSFFVSDFTEVDNNVTRHLPRELNASDWQIMIIHYLGLDHIGHIEGPKSTHIRPKLLEMDAIIKEIHHHFTEWGGSSAIVVCGDHGMKDSGGHGGASNGEVQVPLILIGQSCPTNRFNEDRTVAQIDLVPTLAVLLGVPIPRSNLGRVIPTLIGHLPIERQLYALYYNTLQVAELYTRIVATGSQVFSDAMQLHATWTSSSEEVDADQIKAKYSSALNFMSSNLANSMVTFDMYSIAAAVIILWQVCYILLVNIEPVTSGATFAEGILYCLLMLMGNIMYCSYTNSESLLCSTTLTSVTILFGVILVIAINTCIMRNSCFRLQHPHQDAIFLILGSILQLVSLSATSLVEEEHLVWYFLWTTFSLLSLYKLLVDSESAVLVSQVMSNLVLHRLLRKWNQTGDKWASLPDIGDWLVEPHNKTYLSLILFLGLVGVLWVCYVLSKEKHISILDTGLCLVATSCIYCYRLATGSVAMPFDYPQSRGIGEVSTFWCVLAVLLIRLMFQPDTCRLTCLWLLLSALLHRPHNVVLLTAHVWSSRLMQGSMTCRAMAHVWLGMVFYFYQGNSNSLASVDVAAGYVGQQSYSPITVGLLMLANTYSAPILSFLLLLNHFTDDFQKLFGVACLLLASMRLLSVAVFTVYVVLQRFHLFVWSVFSPKLLYEAVHTAVLLVILIILQLVLKNYKTRQKHF